MELSNRDLYNRAKEILSKNKDIEYIDGEIYAILMKASGYESFTELVLNFDKKCPNPQYFYRNLNLPYFYFPHTFHGQSLLSFNFSSISFSLKVSMHCQNP